MPTRGRYVAVSASWNHFVDDPRKEGWLQPRLDSGAIPIGTEVVSIAETGGPQMTYDNQWLGLRFLTATAARTWIGQQCEEWNETEEDYPRFETLREIDAHLDDASMGAYLGLR